MGRARANIIQSHVQARRRGNHNGARLMARNRAPLEGRGGVIYVNTPAEVVEV